VGVRQTYKSASELAIAFVPPHCAKNVGGVLHHACWPKKAKVWMYLTDTPLKDTDTFAVVCALNAQFDAPLLLLLSLLLLADSITCSV